MALTNGEQTALRAIITREGGLETVVDEVRALFRADRKASTLAALQNAISITVSDWPAVQAAVVAQGASVTLYDVMADILAAAQSRNTANLGPLLVQLVAAVKANYNL